MPKSKRHPLIRGAGITSAGTFVSRVLGMVRDMATASLLGMSGGGVMDAFVTAFRVPNFFRRMFGEGTLAASYLPVVAAELERDRDQAWRLVSTTMTWLGLVLAVLVLVAEGACGLAWLAWGDEPGMDLLLKLTAALMPYALFVSLAAQAAGTLQCLNEFSVPALAPTVLNLCWLTAAWFVAPWFGEKETQAGVLAAAVVVGGVLQLAVQVPALRRRGFHFRYDWQASRGAIGRITRSMGPMVLGLAITQINTLVDSLLAWCLTAPADGSQIPGLPGVNYPLEQGAAAAIYYAERIYEFPLGILGIAVATAIFPLLSRHAARGDHARLGADLTLGLRLVLFLGVPASLGLTLVAEPLARLLFERGEFTPADTLRAARMIACYSCGVWAFCALPVVVRGFYALGEQGTPVRIGLAATVLNLVLAPVLAWPLAESGLAVATTTAAIVQLVLLAGIFSRRAAPLGWKLLAGTAIRAALAAAAMTALGTLTLSVVLPWIGLTGRFARVAAPCCVCAATYFAAYALLGRQELRTLLGHIEHHPASTGE